MQAASAHTQQFALPLAEKGLKVSNQLMSVIFRNPFYCGLMAHNMLEGKVIPGNHEPLISQDLFLRVNGVLAKNAQGYKINEENEEHFRFDVAADALMLIKDQAIATFNQLTKGHKEEYQVLQSSIMISIRRSKGWKSVFIEEEINAELYNKFFEKYKVEKKEIEDNLMKASDKVSNLEECVNTTLEFATEMLFKWHSADYSTKRASSFTIS